ncbi:APC family permease [Ktedonobacter robiniae]|uniref:Amino acid permease n=1 Tax=Ktedonobacter robiniae TaxID=2778365 RepID=A0ABQ3V514_9CHLR|nr:APC family permease [Ktedonobacter robiniae]GHO59652.1 putative amino acid permease [Ktedonobacter robiniae]
MDTSIREVTTEATLQEKKKLRKELRLFDLVFYTIAAIINVDTLGAVSSNGGQALTWLLISAVTFLIPYGLLTAEMGSTFPQEGGVYEWCKLAGGRFYGAIASILYWISNPLWVGGTLAVTSIAAIKTFWFGNPDVLWGGSALSDALLEMGVALAFIWGTTWCAITSLHVGKWLALLGSYAKLALFAVFSILALVFFFGDHSSGEHLGLGDLVPTGNLGVIFSVILPVLIFNWAGFETQNGAGEEMHNPQRDIPRSIIRAGICVALAYAIPIAIILFTLPKSQLSNATGFLSAFKVVSGVLPAPVATGLGLLVALALVIGLASSGGTWLIGADRTYAIASLDRTAPVFLGRFSSRFGTPIVVNTMSGIVATIAMAAAIVVNSFSSDPNIATLFTLVLGFSISTATMAYLFVFPAFLILRYKYPQVKRVYKVPGGMVGAWVVTILTFLYAGVATYFILIPTDDTVANYKGLTRLTYELTQFTPLVVILLLAIVFFIWGQSEKRNKDVVVELNLNPVEEASADVLSEPSQA